MQPGPNTAPDPTAGVESDRPLDPCIHREPPLTPAGLLARPALIATLGAVFALMAIAAALSGGKLLLTWDEPLQHFVEGARTPALNRFFLQVSSLGSTMTVLTLGTGTALLVWHRCRAVATMIVVAMLSRPLLEFTLKLLVSRDRPDLEQLVPGHGFSFPSGHPLAAVAFWGLLPVVVTVYTRRRAIWWASVVVSAALILLIGASRVYLGVHWFSDVFASMILAGFFLLGVEWVLRRQHRRYPCERTEWPLDEVDSADQLDSPDELATSPELQPVGAEAQLEARH